MGDKYADQNTLSEYGSCIVIVMLFILMAGIVVSNGFVGLLIIYRKRLHTIPNFYIVALSSAHLLVGIFVISSTVTGVFNAKSSSIWCATAPFLELFAFSSGIFYMVGLTVDRYCLVMYPLFYKPTIRGTNIKLTIMTLAAFIYSFHVIVQQLITDSLFTTGQTNKSTIDDETVCNMLTEDETSDIWFRIVDFVMLFIIPIVVMIVMYTKLVQKLWAKTVFKTMSTENKKRTVRSSVICVASFFVCWFPFYIIELVHDGLELKTKVEVSSEAYTIMRFIAIFMALSNSVINPIIYGFLNKKFQNEVQLVKAMHCCKVNKISTLSNVLETMPETSCGKQRTSMFIVGGPRKTIGGVQK